VQLRSARRQFHGTFFLRNRPELDLMCAFCNSLANGSTLSLTVLACSNGAEVYSILWAIRRARPDLRIAVKAIDISPEILEIAKKGVYSTRTDERIGSAIFERLTAEEVQALFDKEGDWFRIKPWLKEGIHWATADATDPELPARFGDQDIVVANRFLCHMRPPEAEKCLRNIARLVKPGGYLFASGVDLDVRTKIAMELGCKPVRTLLEEIHEGDPSLRRDWPWKYWGLEPLAKNRLDWAFRYASVFQLNEPADTH
jgi:chemotaxis methyl-accepting protein methylase